MAQDEYDRSFGPLFTLLWKNAKEEKLSTYLWKVLEKRIGLQPEQGATEETVKALKRIVLRHKVDLVAQGK